jgi:hypothetical protein
METAARRAMNLAEVEAAAVAAYVDLRAEPDARLELIDRFVEVNDLADRNISAAMTASLQFSRGLNDGRFFERNEADILADVWAQEPEIRRDTEQWLYGYLLLAYQPLPLEDLEAYVAFSRTGPGEAMNAALFAGFEHMYNDISYALGRAIALSAAGSAL